ncbi:MAG TPA: TolC family protein [Terriglobales bacterium]|nr:TolC family protein [Terriglobales bacterium]
MPGLSDLGGENPFAGSVSGEKAVPGTVSITLLDAIDRGLKYNLGLVSSIRAQESVRAARLRALSALMPSLSARAVESIQQVNLAAYGFAPPTGSPIVGPFAVTDIRASANVPIIDIESMHRLRSADQNSEAAQFNYRNARELVVVAVGLAYVQALAAEARVDAVQAQLQTAQTLYQSAVDQKNAGVVPVIDVLRAQVEMQAQQQRLVAARNSFNKLKLQLARVIGLPVGQEYTLAQKIPYKPAPPLTLEESISRALRDRPDFASAQARVRAAEYTQNAARSERLPRLGVSGDYGVIGPNLGNSHGTFSAAAAITVPIYQGGRIQSDIQQADATLKLRQAEADDLRGRIEYEVRAAFLDVASAAELVRVGQSTLELANQTLAQAQDRFRAGVTNNIEVVQAQESVANSNEAFISSTLQFNLAKLALARSLGTAERATKEFLGGTP